jgi:hypothetical protein
MNPTKKIISIDVGIKNLAFCLFSVNDQTHNQILLWDVVNLSQKTEIKCCDQGCNSPVKFSKNNTYYCLKHAKKNTTYKIAKADLKMTTIKKCKVKDLGILAAKYNINIPLKETKVGILSLFQKYLDASYFDNVESVNASKLDLVTIGKNMMCQLDIILKDHLLSIDLVIIENQISPIANRMKTVQGMISQYFIMRNQDIQIEFVSSANKLKGQEIVKVADSDDEKETQEKETQEKENQVKVKHSYSDRKKMGIKYCLDLINGTEHVNFFINHKKQDDLADSFLQGIWYINNKINKINKSK